MFPLTAATSIQIDPGAGAARDAASLLRRTVHRSTGYPLMATSARRSGSRIIFTTLEPAATTTTLSTPGPDRAALPSTPSEAYTIKITTRTVTIAARSHDGFIWAVQTLRQIMPPEIESPQRVDGTWKIPTATVSDDARYAWRGFLVDVARHFVRIDDLESIIDTMSAYKMNRLHLHLTDDEGWRIEIPGYPELTTVGASASQNGSGGGGGHYSVAQYQALNAYAQAHGVTIVPEIDVPSHALAATTARPELRCPEADAEWGKPGYDPDSLMVRRNLCPTSEATWTFFETVVRTVAEATPGPYLHVGGDEAFGMKVQDFVAFTRRMVDLVHAQGKFPIGWAEIAGFQAPPPDAILQAWNDPRPFQSDLWSQAPGLIASPSSRTYINATYDTASKRQRIGWTGVPPLNTKDAYDWDPEDVFANITNPRVLGLEACLWGDHLVDRTRFAELILPRLPGFAELGWSPRSAHSWANYRVRLAAQAARWKAWGVPFYADPVVPWPDPHKQAEGTARTN